VASVSLKNFQFVEECFYCLSLSLVATFLQRNSSNFIGIPLSKVNYECWRFTASANFFFFTNYTISSAAYVTSF
jgi:hypothetical protein